MFTFQNRVGQAMGALRRRREIQQKALAERLDVSAEWLSRVENGQGQPSVEMVDQFLELSRTEGYDLLDEMYGESRDPDHIAEQILDLLRLGPLTAEQRREARFEILRLGFGLQLRGGESAEEAGEDSPSGD